jgi:hypothetical protein
MFAADARCRRDGSRIFENSPCEAAAYPLRALAPARVDAQEWSDLIRATGLKGK